MFVAIMVIAALASSAAAWISGEVVFAWVALALAAAVLVLIGARRLRARQAAARHGDDATRETGTTAAGPAEPDAVDPAGQADHPAETIAPVSPDPDSTAIAAESQTDQGRNSNEQASAPEPGAPPAGAEPEVESESTTAPRHDPVPVRSRTADPGDPEAATAAGTADKVSDDRASVGPHGSAATGVPGPVDDQTDVVSVQPGRRRYHRPGCEVIADRATDDIALEDARDEGFSPCTRCHPVATAT
ncbi:hypothetical protein LQ327_33215 [Actinomycetospora endophytica]|uniref:Ada DNA repair metal-binding domain-containing protein n=1 Tax=Actinomycetospora endophytica TaxID=2291215 RepID=A0ABS8PLF6_9PSEU|nr:hypothetical protein [Actinomycetospora endophytica]MCD2198236.1 hypothetical protein [Actinomycetospora endophytica]